MATKRKTKIRMDLFHPTGGKRIQPTGENNPALEIIWHTVSAIPRGKVSTYGAVAQAAGLPGRARQVGYALRMAPEDLHIPWHRVLGAGGKIVFPPSSHEYKEQSKRLRAEGLKVKDGRAPLSAIITWESP